MVAFGYALRQGFKLLDTSASPAQTAYPYCYLLFYPYRATPAGRGMAAPPHYYFNRVAGGMAGPGGAGRAGRGGRRHGLAAAALFTAFVAPTRPAASRRGICGRAPRPAGSAHLLAGGKLVGLRTVCVVWRGAFRCPTPVVPACMLLRVAAPPRPGETLLSRFRGLIAAAAAISLSPPVSTPLRSRAT